MMWLYSNKMLVIHMLTPQQITLLQTKKAYLLARATYLVAQVALVDQELAAASSPTIDFTKHDPAWKTGVRLSKTGETAVLAAYDDFMSQADVAALFRISATAAQNWYAKWKRSRRLMRATTPIAPAAGSTTPTTTAPTPTTTP